MIPVVNARHTRPTVGHTLGEVLIALGLLAVVLVFLVGLFVQLFATSGKGLDSTIALQMAESLMAEANDALPSRWDTLNRDELVYNRDPQNPQSFHSRLTYVKLREEPMGDVYQLLVEVYWSDQAPAATSDYRRGYGKQSVTLNKIIYVANMKP